MQRKIIRDATGVYHMLYESAGLIWYTKSADGLSNWSVEIPVSETVAGYANRTPALTYQTNPPILLAVWELYGEGQGWNEHVIAARSISPTSG